MKKNVFLSENLTRASKVLNGDRMGVTAQIEDVINSQLTDALSEFFILNGNAKVQVVATKNGFEIIIMANAKSVKQLKVLP